MSDYFVGELVRLSASFGVKESDGSITPTDPDTVLLRYKIHGAEEQQLEYGIDMSVINDGVGQYHADVELDERGLHYFRWESTGPAQTAGEATFLVRSYFSLEAS